MFQWFESFLKTLKNKSVYYKCSWNPYWSKFWCYKKMKNIVFQCIYKFAEVWSPHCKPILFNGFECKQLLKWHLNFCLVGRTHGIMSQCVLWMFHMDVSYERYLLLFWIWLRYKLYIVCLCDFITWFSLTFYIINVRHALYSIYLKTNLFCY